MKLQKKEILFLAPNWYGVHIWKKKEKERLKNYPSPIQPDKETSDRDYNAGVEFCIDHIDTDCFDRCFT